jgi:predicted MFS family arabinose efflux permease
VDYCDQPFCRAFFLWGGGYNTSPVFVGALLNAFGWGHTRVSWLPSTLAIAVGVSGPISGWLLDRIEARTVMGTGAALAATGFVVASRANGFSGLLIANLILDDFTISPIPIQQDSRCVH